MDIEFMRGWDSAFDRDGTHSRAAYAEMLSLPQGPCPTCGQPSTAVVELDGTGAFAGQYTLLQTCHQHLAPYADAWVTARWAGTSWQMMDPPRRTEG